MDYATLKLIHVTAVLASFSGFLARGIGVLRGASWVRQRPARTVPHVVDSILLLSALGMLWTIHTAPWALPWLRAKLVGLVVYVALGVLALRPPRGESSGHALRVGRLALICALLVFAYIASVALTKSPKGALMWLQGTEGPAS